MSETKCECPARKACPCEGLRQKLSETIYSRDLAWEDKKRAEASRAQLRAELSKARKEILNLTTSKTIAEYERGETVTLESLLGEDNCHCEGMQDKLLEAEEDLNELNELPGLRAERDQLRALVEELLTKIGRITNDH